MSDEVKAKVTIGTTELTVRPLTARALRQLSVDGHLKRLTAGEEEFSAERIDAMVAVILAAVQRSHAHITSDWLLDNVEQQDLAHLFEVCIDVAGFIKRSAASKTESP